MPTIAEEQSIPEDVEQSIPEDVELRTKIEIAERRLKFGSVSIESKNKLAALIAGYKKQLAKIEKKTAKKNG